MSIQREKIIKYFLNDIEVLIDCIIESFDNLFKKNVIFFSVNLSNSNCAL